MTYQKFLEERLDESRQYNQRVTNQFKNLTKTADQLLDQNNRLIQRMLSLKTELENAEQNAKRHQSLWVMAAEESANKMIKILQLENLIVVLRKRLAKAEEVNNGEDASVPDLDSPSTSQ
jgi:hypothetical protein